MSSPRRRVVAGGRPLSGERPAKTSLGRRVQATKQLGGFGSIGLEIGVAIAIGLLGGRWLDAKLGTAPWLMWTGFGIGIATAVRTLLRALTHMRRVADREEQEMGNPEPLYPDDADREGARGDDGAASEEPPQPDDHDRDDHDRDDHEPDDREREDRE
jgi:ATP synthase protein I